MKEIKQRSLDPSKSSGFMKRLMGDIVETDVRARRLPVPTDAGPEQTDTVSPMVWLKDFQDRAERDERLAKFVDQFDGQCMANRADGVPISLSDAGVDRIAECYASVLVPRTSSAGLDRCAKAKVKDRMSDRQAITRSEGGLRDLLATYPVDDIPPEGLDMSDDTPFPYQPGDLAKLWAAELAARKKGSPVICSVDILVIDGGPCPGHSVDFYTPELLGQYISDTFTAGTDTDRLAFHVTDAMDMRDRADCDRLIAARTERDWSVRADAFLQGLEERQKAQEARNLFLAADADKGIRPCEGWVPTPDDVMRQQRKMAQFLDGCDGVVGQFGPGAPCLMDPLRGGEAYVPTYSMSKSVRTRVETAVRGLYPGMDDVGVMSDLELVQKTSETAKGLEAAYEQETAATGKPVAKGMMPNTGETLEFRTQAFMDAYLGASVPGTDKARKTMLQVQENLDAMENDAWKKGEERYKQLEKDPHFQVGEPSVGLDYGPSK